MEIRPVRAADLDRLIDIDGTIESDQYLHVEHAGEGLARSWKIEERPLRQRKTDRNQASDDVLFTLKQVVTGIEEGMAILADHDGVNVALLVARLEPQYGTMKVLDVRVDYEHRRQGLGSAMTYQVVSEARNRELRAVSAETRTDNFPAAKFLEKCGFDLAGLDARRHTNHDLVKEAVTLFWYAALD
ncbi:MAG TPA: GNAT family N-acetyltransferase [Tepidisphaeraceae bacterium]|nr:GNAT family N-acetyltransferase [Tepidisphaeraceae bacterium]